jgi:hypothetical protein
MKLGLGAGINHTVASAELNERVIDNPNVWGSASTGVDVATFLPLGLSRPTPGALTAATTARSRRRRPRRPGPRFQTGVCRVCRGGSRPTSLPGWPSFGHPRVRGAPAPSVSPHSRGHPSFCSPLSTRFPSRSSGAGTTDPGWFSSTPRSPPHAHDRVVGSTDYGGQGAQSGGEQDRPGAIPVTALARVSRNEPPGTLPPATANSNPPTTPKPIPVRSWSNTDPRDRRCQVRNPTPRPAALTPPRPGPAVPATFGGCPEPSEPGGDDERDDGDGGGGIPNVVGGHGRRPFIGSGGPGSVGPVRRSTGAVGSSTILGNRR